jgi:hypothetical protein
MATKRKSGELDTLDAFVIPASGTDAPVEKAPAAKKAKKSKVDTDEKENSKPSGKKAAAAASKYSSWRDVELDGEEEVRVSSH